MKIKKRIAAFSLTIILLISLLPAALAANDASVIKSISLGNSAKGISTSTIQPGSSRYLTLYVPYSYSGSCIFDLHNDLVYDTDLTVYKSIVITPAADTIALSNILDSSYIKLSVTFNLTSESDTDVKSETDYYIRVVKADQIAPVFSGVLNLSVNLSAASVSLKTTISDAYSPNEGKALGYVAVDGSNSDTGSLAFPSGLSFGSEIPVASLDSLAFLPVASGVVSYSVTAYDSANSKVGTAVMTITVYSKPAVSSAIAMTVYIGSTQNFTKADFSSHCSMNGSDVQEIEITLSDTAAGTWYVNGSAVPSGTITLSALPDISLSFSAAVAGTASFSWNVENAAGYADSVGSGTITVSTASLTLTSYTASTSVIRGSTFSTGVSSFAYQPATAALKYLKIVTIPSAADGYLSLSTALPASTSLGYLAVAANTALKAGTVIPYSYIAYLQLATKSGGTGAYVSFTWSATADASAAGASWASAASYTVYFKTGGTVNYQTTMNVPVNLSASDFSSVLISSAGTSLSSIAFTLPISTSGKLWYNYSLADKTGTAVAAKTLYYASSNPNISAITFVPATGYSGTVSIAYSAYGLDGSCVIGTLIINVQNFSGGIVSCTIDKNGKIQLDASDFSKTFKDSTGSTLSYLRFSLPAPAYGTLYYNYVSSSNFDSTVSAYSNYYVYTAPYLSYITFAGAADYTGTVLINYTAYNSSGNGYSGRLIVFIVDSPAGIVTYNVKENGMINLSGSDFSSEFIKVTGAVMSYVLFASPDKNSGSLYTGYSSGTKTGTKVSSSTKYYYGAPPDISGITYVPASGFTGEVSVKYTVYSSSGKAYAGKLKFEVGEGDGGTISLSTAVNMPVNLSSANFVRSFYVSSGGKALSNVVFTLPSISYGSLYYGYSSTYGSGTAVSSGNRYYVDASPFISNITFVPAASYTGTFTISFTAYSSDGTSYPGKILMTVGAINGMIYYRTSLNQAITFNSSDFYSACYNLLNSTVSYVSFSLPSPSEGTLYYGYSQSYGYYNAVSSSSNYYYSGFPYISQVTFVPASGFSGTLSFGFTGWDTSGNLFYGTVVISVSDSLGGNVSCSTDNETPVGIKATDFSTAFQQSTGSGLYCVSFTPPEASAGQLYYGYVSASNYSSAVTSASRYYLSFSPLLSNVSFVPNSSFSGTVTIAYTAYTSAMLQYSGKLTITVRDANAYPFTDVEDSYPWAANAIQYLYKNSVLQGSGDGLFNPGDNMTRGDFMLMLYRAFKLTASGSDNFSDVPSGSYYFDAISACKALGIAKGNGGYFYPGDPISRQDAMVLILRTLYINGNPPDPGSSDTLSGYSDNGDISDYASDSVAALVGAGYVQGSGGMLRPKSLINRAETAKMLYNVLSA